MIPVDNFKMNRPKTNKQTKNRSPLGNEPSILVLNNQIFSKQNILWTHGFIVKYEMFKEYNNFNGLKHLLVK